MRNALLTLHPGLAGISRVPTLAGGRAEPRRIELVALVLIGAGATVLSTSVDLRLGLPGHHIVFSIFPMALGFALVPRRRAGTLMGGSALAVTALLWQGGTHLPGVGALTSLWLTGPFLDLALRWGGRGWRLYGAFVLAGAGTNAVAFVVRAATKALGLRGMGGGRSLEAWLPQAIWTYALAGVVAGLISAAAWFQLRERAAGSP